jgi:DNA replication and repair protein RecF
MERVQLDELTLQNFRNIAAAQLRPGRRFNVVSGKNGMGKTNLLEAVYLLGTLRSYRTSARRELLRHGQESALVEGIFGGAAVGMRCEILIRPDERRVRVDGKQQQPNGGHFRSLPMVLFHPGNLELVQGPPEGRRRFLDRALFQAAPSYPANHRDYGRALASRNRLLREQRVDRRAIAAFDRQLTRHGAEIVRFRDQLVSSLRAPCGEAFDAMSGACRVELSYRPSVPGVEEQLAEALEQKLKLDCERGYTSIGPHADDLLLELDGKPARRFASQGQQRALVLSLKIAETRALAAATSRIPLLLLDDVSSELDELRNRRLFEFLNGVGGQVFITSTRGEEIQLRNERVDFVVDEGDVQRST